MQQINHVPLLPKQVPTSSRVQKSLYLTKRGTGLLQYKVQLSCPSWEPGPVALAYIPQTCNPPSHRRKHTDSGSAAENLQKWTFRRADLSINCMSDTAAWIHLKQLHRQESQYTPSDDYRDTGFVRYLAIWNEDEETGQSQLGLTGHSPVITGSHDIDHTH